MLKYGLAHLKSSALMCATKLGILRAISLHGEEASLANIVKVIGIPSSKVPCLRRLMRLLTVTGIFAARPDDQGEPIYMLTAPSRLLIQENNKCDLSNLLCILTRPTTTVSTFFNLEDWFKEESSITPFERVHGKSPWSLTEIDRDYNSVMNNASFSDTSFVLSIVLKEDVGRNIFKGVTSLVDVAGGHGAAALAVAQAFPNIKCSVLDLHQVISEAPKTNKIKFVEGDMFEYIPPADAILLKVLGY